MFRRSARVAAVLCAAVLIGGSASRPAPWQPDPDWPCQQRLVPKLVAAEYWNGPPLARLGDWHADPAVAKLVRQLAPRPVTTADGVGAIDVFARSLSGDRQRRLGLLFLGLLDETNRERAALIDELKEIGRGQRERAAFVSRLAGELDAVPSEAAAKRADLQLQHDFAARSFEEIQRTISYACEAPVALDARLGAWARALQSAVSG